MEKFKIIFVKPIYNYIDYCIFNFNDSCHFFVVPLVILKIEGQNMIRKLNNNPDHINMIYKDNRNLIIDWKNYFLVYEGEISDYVSKEINIIWRTPSNIELSINKQS